MTHIALEELIGDPAGVIGRVADGHETLVIEKAHAAVAVLKPVAGSRSRRRKKTADDLAAFRAAAGTWSDVDTEAFIANTYESRRLSSRPPVDL